MTVRMDVVINEKADKYENHYWIKVDDEIIGSCNGIKEIGNTFKLKNVFIHKENFSG